MADLFERLMSLHYEAFEDAHYSTAYHTLAAALHCAADQNDPERLISVEKTASAQLAWIDAHAPLYEHSTHSAALRGHASIYAMLSKQAQTKALLLKRETEQGFSRVAR